MTPMHTVSVSYVLDELTLVIKCNPPVMMCWFADILMAWLSASQWECHLHLVLLALQVFGSTPYRLVLPNDRHVVDQMLTLVVALMLSCSCSFYQLRATLHGGVHR